ncbi:MAG TPA: hypothetical protein VJ011_11610, partial [Steroidobacteraceae bacterium]|nr:hypothetical protein [Steroidobacteraceae bacterium]
MIRECSRRGSGAAVLLVLALTAGCAPTLRPAPEAQRVPGRELAAITENAGVSMVVEAGAWDARPKNLDRELTPLRVTIENKSNRPVRVRYDDFTIDTGRGITYSPLPPLKIEG